MSFASKIHNSSNKTNIHAIEEIAMTSLIVLVSISNASKVNLSDSTFFYPPDNLSILIFFIIPKVCKVVHHTIRNNSQRYLIANFFLSLHQAVYSIIQGRIATNNDYSLITIIDIHLHQSFYAPRVFALHIVVVHLLFL